MRPARAAPAAWRSGPSGAPGQRCNDLILIATQIINWDVKRVHCDDRSNTDVLCAHILAKLVISIEKLKLMCTLTYGIGLDELPIHRSIDLPFMLKGKCIGTKEELYTSKMARFIIINFPSPNNAIVGKQTHGSIHMRPDVKYLTVTFKAMKGYAPIFIN